MNGRQAYAISHQSSDLNIHFVFSGLTEFVSKLDQRYDKYGRGHRDSSTTLCPSMGD